MDRCVKAIFGRFFARVDEHDGIFERSTPDGLVKLDLSPRLAQIEAAPFPYNSMEDLVADFAKLMGLDPAVAGALVKDASIRA